jgi:transposase
VAIDLCTTFRAAVRRALPHATVVVDCFHIVQLAQRHLANLRRRLTWKHYGRRARKGDAAYTVRRLLRSNKEDLTTTQLDLIKTKLHGMGTFGQAPPGAAARPLKVQSRLRARISRNCSSVMPACRAAAMARH